MKGIDVQIVGLEVENYGRVKAISLKPDATGAVVVSGRNAQGKTSLLNAMFAAFGGRAANTAAKPVREGEAQAKVVVDLGDMIVTRVWRNGTTHLEVRSAEGAVFKSPQALLDGFIGRLTFDPLAFTRLKAREQKDALLALVDLDVDLEAIDAARAAAFDERTEVGRRKSALGTAVVDEALPTEEVVMADVLQRINVARDLAALNEEDRGELVRLKDKARFVREDLERAKEQVARLENDAKRIEMEVESKQAAVDNLAEPESIDELQLELAGAEATNAAIRANNTAREIVAAISAREAEYQALTEKIQAIDKEKAAALALATFPVDGLGFDEDGVTFNNVPFAQASSAEQIRVSMAMAIAANPKLRVVRIMDGSLLDDEGMKIITDLACDNDFQVWIERVANSDGVGFVIEDGELVGTEVAGDVA